jgi:hypothetical protein
MEDDTMPPSPGNQPPLPDSATLAHWQLVYREARRAFDFRVQEVQQGQQRNATVLTTTGLLLAFLATTTSVFVPGPTSRWPAALFLVAMGTLAVGLGAGALALWPRILIKGDQARTAPSPRQTSTPEQSQSLFLEAHRILEAGTILSSQQLLQQLTESIARDTQDQKVVMVMSIRRRLIKAQLLCVFGGTVLLFAALIARLVAS